MEPEQKENQAAPEAAPTSEAPATSSSGEVTPPLSHAVPFYKRYQTAIAAVVAVLILLGAGYYVYTKNYQDGGTVATVNGKVIYKKEFDDSVALMEQSATAQGIDLSQETIRKEIRDQALTVLINNALLITAAEDAGFKASNEDIEAKYAELVTEVGGEEELTQRMTEIGLTPEKLRSNIKERILADQYIESETDISSLTVSDEEVNQFMASLNTGETELPPIEEIRPQIEAQILSQKQQQIVADLIAKLRTEATIETRI
jgi:hypothetical protein